MRGLLRPLVYCLISSVALGLARPAGAADPARSADAAPAALSPRPWHEGLFPPATIYMEPLVLAWSEDRQALQEAAVRVGELFEVPVAVRLPEAERPDLPNELGAPYTAGDRLLFPPVAAAMQYIWRRDPVLPDALAIIAVSGAPIGFPARSGRIVEGATWSMRAQGIAAVSLPLLRAGSPAAPESDDVVQERLAKAMARMLGQALGLRDAAEPTSVMYRPPSLTALDSVPFTLAPAQRIELRVIRALCALADGRATPEELEVSVRRRAQEHADPAAAALLAILLERRDARTHAHLALDQAMVLTPALPRLHLSRARLAYREGDWAGAARAWAKFEDTHPHLLAWAGGAAADRLLAEQGLPARADGAAATVWREPLEQAQAALEVGDATVAAETARAALTRELELAARFGDQAPFEGRSISGLGRPSRLGTAAGVLAVALARSGAWDDAAEALALATEHLASAERDHLEHVAVRIAAGRAEVPVWQRPDRSAWSDRLRIGLDARARGDAVAALDAWGPLLAALDTPWAPNVPAVDLAELHAARGDVTRARDVLIRARRAGLFDGRARDLWRRLPAAQPGDTATALRGPVRRYSIRRFRPAITTTADTVWLGTTDGLLRLDRSQRSTALQHVALGLPEGTIHAIAARGETLWLGTTAGLYRGDSRGQWTRVLEADGTPVPAVTTLQTEPNGTLLAGTIAGLCAVSRDGGVVLWPAGLPRARVSALAHRGAVAAVNFTRLGPAVRQRGVWQVIAAPNPVGPLTRFGGIALDAFHRVALTQVQVGGVAICRESPFAVYCDDLPSGTDVIGPVAARGGLLWLAAGTEVAQWDPSVGWTPAATLPAPDPGPVLAIAPDEEDGLWVVTPRSVLFLQDGEFKLLVQYGVRSIWQQLVADPRGGVWKIFARTLAPPKGVPGPATLPPGGRGDAEARVVLDPTGAPWTVAGNRLYRARSTVWVAVADTPAEATGPLRLWTATRRGVWADDGARVWGWSPQAGWVHHAPPDDVTPDAPAVRGVAVTRDGRVWVAWSDRVHVREEGAWREAEGLPRRTVRGLAAAGESVWVATANDGVYRLGAEPAHWSRAEGLPDHQVAVVAAGGGSVWVAGGSGGVARWDGTRWRQHHVGNLQVALAADAVVPTADGGVWFQVGASWYEHGRAP